MHTDRRVLPAGVNEACLEHIRGYEIDRAERPPVEVKLSYRMGEEQPPQGDGHLSRAVQHPPRLCIVLRLTTPRGVAERGAHQTADDEGRTTGRDHVAVLISPVSQGSPGRTLPGPDGKGAVSLSEPGGRGDEWAASHSAFEEIGENVARVPQVLV